MRGPGEIILYNAAVTAEITRHNPSCFLFVVDQSSSMAQPFGSDRASGQTKAEGVALALNNLLRNLIITCSKSDGVRHYFDVGIIGYGLTVGPAWTGPLQGQELVSITDVANYFARMSETASAASSDGVGGAPRAVRTPIWIEPVAEGSTLMCGALGYAHRILAHWLQRNPSSVPPVVVHITDGEATDGDPAPFMTALTALENGGGGRVMLFNVHLSSSRDATPLSFPDTPDGLPNKFARLLFDQASHLSSFMRAVAWDNGLLRNEEARAFVLNADPTLMVLALEIGTRPGSSVW